MPSVDYSYQLSTTCVSGVNIDALSYEIHASEITKNLHYVFVDNDSDNIVVWFRETLTSPDEDLLLYLLQNHSGRPVGMTTTSGVYPDYSKNLIINEDGIGIGVSTVKPFHVTTVTTAAAHDIAGDAHFGMLLDSQIPSFITRDSELINASGILNTKIDDLDFYTTNEIDTIVSGLAEWDHDHDLRYLQIAHQEVIDHGSISGLSDDDHTQYHTDARGDLRYSLLGHAHDDRYYTESEVNTISGNINTKITNTSGTLQTQITYYSNHTNLNGLANDDHTQYHTDGRGDARYYTQTQLNNGQLDTRYYTETEIDTISGLLNTKITNTSGTLQTQITYYSDHGNLSGLGDDDHPQYLNQARGDARYYTETELNNGQLDTRYYTETELNSGQLDTRYYTEAEVNAISGAINAKIITDHGGLTGLGDDDHPQYLNQARGDARYYTEAELNAGQLDTRYYTESELNSGQLDNRYYTETEVNTISGALNAKIITDHGNLSGLGDDDHPHYHNDTRGDLRYLKLIGGTILNDLIVLGNLSVSGTQFTSSTETVLIEDNLLYLNNGETASGISEGIAGIQIDRGTATDYLIVFDDTTDTFKAGISGSLQSVAMREDTPINNYIAYWNESSKRFDTTSSMLYTDIASKSLVSTTSGVLQNQINTNKDHGNLTGLGDDDHPQYHNDSRGDTRYYTKALLDSGQLDNRYYTELEVNTISGALQTSINTKEPIISPKNTAFNVNFGSTAGTACQGNDARLSDARTPLAHGNERHISTFVTSADVTYETLNTNGDVGTSAGQLAIGNHTHAQLHDRQHALTSSSDHTATANRVFYSDNSGVITELPLGVSGTVLTSTGASAAPSWTTTGQISTLLPICQIKRTTSLTLSAGIWTDIAFNVKEIETDNTVLEYDTVNTDRITIKQAGYYVIDYDANIYYEGASRIRVNDTTVISGSYIPKDGDQNCNVVPHSFSRSTYVYLNANDFITLQLMSNYGLAVSTNASLSIASVKGIKGDTGSQGPGSSVVVQSEGSSVGGSPFGTLNFKGATVSGTAVSGVVDITVVATPVSPGAPTNSVQFNNAGSFGGDAGLIYSSASDKLTISGAGQTTRLVLGGEDDNNNATLYIQVDGDATSEGMRTYFKRSAAGISGWIVYHYDQNTPNIRIIDEDDDPPYISFQTIRTGTYSAPTYDNRFGTRGPAAGATTGFQWIVNGTSISEMDSQFFMPPKGTTGQRPGTPVAGYTRYNTTISGLENYDGRSWQPQVFGTYFNEASSETDSSTTSTSWSQKVRLTTSALPAGKYRIGWSYNIRQSNTSYSAQARVQINDTGTVHNYMLEPKDGTSNEEDAVGGFYYYTVSTGGTTLDIDLDFSTENSGGTTTIRRARLEFWRVS
jgi:hypothetical protein